MFSVSSLKPSGRSGKMRALSFKTGIACLCGTEVKEKLQCEYSPKSGVELGIGRGVVGGERVEISRRHVLMTQQSTTRTTL